MTTFKQVSISGDPAMRGLQHGKALASEIAAAIDYYTSIFQMSETEIFDRATYFREVIEAFNPDYLTEIDGIAKGANLDPLWITALNARTELLSLTKAGQAQECTALCFPEAKLLGQNWDWAAALEPLTIVMRIARPDGHVIRMITEPGIIGKIGMNSTGLGVCLNILRCGRELTGVPIHVMLRAVLDQRDVTSALALIETHASGKASNLLLADVSGQCADVEFADDRQFTLRPENGVLIHTNHYLGEMINDPADTEFASSYARMAAAQRQANPASGDMTGHMKTILTDRSNRELPIFRAYVPDPQINDVGTVCTIIMELVAGRMQVRRGNGSDAEFVSYPV